MTRATGVPLAPLRTSWGLAALLGVRSAEYVAHARLHLDLVDALLLAEAAPEPWSDQQLDTARWASMRLAGEPTATGLRCVLMELRAAFGEPTQKATIPAFHHRDGLVTSNAAGFGGIHAPEHGAMDAQEGGQPTQELGRRDEQHNG